MNHTLQRISQNRMVLSMEFLNGSRKPIGDKEFCVNFEVKHQYKLEGERLMFKLVRPEVLRGRLLVMRMYETRSSCSKPCIGTYSQIRFWPSSLSKSES
jgi:hypothetical protein